MIGNRVGFGDLAQGLALVALLPARLAARLLAQAPGAPPLLLPRRRLAQSIAFDVNVAVVLVVSLLALVVFGVHIAIALGVTSALGVYLVTGGNFGVVQRMLGNTAYEALRAYEFAVIPLFMLMGEFIGKSGAVTDVYRGINRGLKRIPGRLAVATILGNAMFSFVTGVSIASAAAFSRIAYPEMSRYGYHRGFALGAVAGSSCLGMLIPPSVLMIVWGLLTEKSIGKIFAAGVLPGLLLVSLFILYVLGMAIAKPELVGRGKDAEARIEPQEDINPVSLWTSVIGIVLVVVSVLGGIWFGVFTPTEGADAGAFIELVLGLAKGMRTKEIIDSILSVGRTAAPILLLLLITAALYSRTLAMTGVTNDPCRGGFEVTAGGTIVGQCRPREIERTLVLKSCRIDRRNLAGGRPEGHKNSTRRQTVDRLFIAILADRIVKHRHAGTIRQLAHPGQYVLTFSIDHLVGKSEKIQIVRAVDTNVDAMRDFANQNQLVLSPEKCALARAHGYDAS